MLFADQLVKHRSDLTNKIAFHAIVQRIELFLWEIQKLFVYRFYNAYTKYQFRQ